MLFKKKKYVTILQEDIQIYTGRWDDLPLSETIIIQKSIEFFDDPTPCYIHRDAVRIRLILELESLLGDSSPESFPKWLSLISDYMGKQVTQVVFSEK